MTEYHIVDVINEINQQGLHLLSLYNSGVRYVTEQDGEFVPCIPDNVLLFPTAKEIQ